MDLRRRLKHCCIFSSRWQTREKETAELDPKLYSISASESHRDGGSVCGSEAREMCEQWMMVAMGGGLSEARVVLSVTTSPEPTCQDSTMCATSRKPPRNLALPLQFSRPVCETRVVVR